MFTYQTIRNSDVCYLLFGHLNWRGHLKLGLQTLYRVLGLRTKLRYHQRPSIEPPQVLTSPTFHLELSTLQSTLELPKTILNHIMVIKHYHLDTPISISLHQIT